MWETLPPTGLDRSVEENVHWRPSVHLPFLHAVGLSKQRLGFLDRPARLVMLPLWLAHSPFFPLLLPGPLASLGMVPAAVCDLVVSRKWRTRQSVLFLGEGVVLQLLCFCFRVFFKFSRAALYKCELEYLSNQQKGNCYIMLKLWSNHTIIFATCKILILSFNGLLLKTYSYI